MRLREVLAQPSVECAASTPRPAGRRHCCHSRANGRAPRWRSPTPAAGIAPEDVAEDLRPLLQGPLTRLGPGPGDSRRVSSCCTEETSGLRASSAVERPSRSRSRHYEVPNRQHDGAVPDAGPLVCLHYCTSHLPPVHSAHLAALASAQRRSLNTDAAFQIVQVDGERHERSQVGASYVVDRCGWTRRLRRVPRRHVRRALTSRRCVSDGSCGTSRCRR